MKSISVEDVLNFHRKIIDQTGGSYGIRDIGLIESSLNRALTTFDGNDLYKNIVGLGIADGSMDEKDIKQWIKKHIV